MKVIGASGSISVAKKSDPCLVMALMLQHGPLPDDAVVKMAQTFRSGTNDVDAIDFVLPRRSSTKKCRTS
jgi:hypothetical protein